MIDAEPCSVLGVAVVLYPYVSIAANISARCLCCWQGLSPSYAKVGRLQGVCRRVRSILIWSLLLYSGWLFTRRSPRLCLYFVDICGI